MIEALVQAKRSAFSALTAHINARGAAEKRKELWSDYDLAATTLLNERIRRAQFLLGRAA